MLKCLKILSLILFPLQPFLSAAQSQNYEVTVNTVTVWVRVVDKAGQPVQGLSAKDFEIFENDKNVPLTCFEETGGEESIKSGSENETFVKKRLVVYLDLFSINGSEYSDLRPAVEEFLNSIPQAFWEVMMVAFAPDGKLRVLIKPTNDFRKVYPLLEHLPPQSRRDLDIVKKNNEIVSMFRQLQSGINEEMILRRACQIANRYAAEEREISQHSLKALETLMDTLSSEDQSEQKVIAHFSAGFNSDPGRVYYEIIEKMSGINLDELLFNIPECKRDLSFHPSRSVQNTLGGMNRSNITLYSINTRALYPSTAIQLQNNTVNINEDSILTDYRFFQEEMAKESGGLFFPNLRKFNQGIGRIIKDLEHQYVLCYRQPKEEQKTEYRKITVLCKKPGVYVRHRKGYIP